MEIRRVGSQSKLKDVHLVRTDEGVVYMRSVRRIAEHRRRAVVEIPQELKSTILDIPPAPDPLVPPPVVQESVRERERRTQGEASGRR